MKRRGLMVEKVSARIDEAQAAQLDAYVAELQRKMGDGVTVYRADALRLVLGNFLRRRSAQLDQRRRR